jgi:osmotically-inducible protein OsmY
LTYRCVRVEVLTAAKGRTHAHNIKIIARGGKVTLKDRVRTEKEKADIEAKAAAIAGAANVTSEIEVAPPKS